MVQEFGLKLDIKTELKIVNFFRACAQAVKWNM